MRNIFFGLGKIIKNSLLVLLSFFIGNATANCPTASPLLPLQERKNPLLWNQWDVKSGQTLGGILDRFKISPKEVFNLTREAKFKKQLTNLRIGDRLEVGRSLQTCQFKELRLWFSADRYIQVKKESNKFQTKLVQKSIESKNQYRIIIVENSLFYDGMKAGVPNKILVQLEDIFGGHLNFSRDLRIGDQFQLIYSERYIDGRFLDNSAIQAVGFQGKVGKWQVVRFEQDNKAGYYTREGKNMETAFNRNPVRDVRISSRFHPKRLHPILHKIMAHRGVDYAAKIGTPIHVTADGVIVKMGYSPTYGNFIRVQHGRQYLTVYAHISRFKKGMRKNKKVKKGEIIAYVGNTGRSTGPHLHYELRSFGKHVDPLKVKLPRGKAISKKQKQTFLLQAKNRWKALEEKRSIYLAQGETTGNN